MLNFFLILLHTTPAFAKDKTIILSINYVFCKIAIVSDSTTQPQIENTSRNLLKIIKKLIRKLID